MIGSAPTGSIPAPDQFAAPWGARGFLTALDGPVHWIEFGADQDPAAPGPRPGAPPFVFVHGLGGSHLNWCQIGLPLAAGRRAVALDLHGFGLTPARAARPRCAPTCVCSTGSSGTSWGLR